MSYGNHQILCNSISSDSELNINIGKLPRENEERRRHRSKEKRDASHFKLQTWLCLREWGGGWYRIWCSVIGNWQHLLSYIPAWMVHPEMFTRESWDLFANEGDTAWLLCVVRLTVRVVTACRGAEPGFDWPAQCSPDFLLWPTHGSAPQLSCRKLLSAKAVKEDSRE